MFSLVLFASFSFGGDKWDEWEKWINSTWVIDDSWMNGTWETVDDSLVETNSNSGSEDVFITWTDGSWTIEATTNEKELMEGFEAELDDILSVLWVEWDLELIGSDETDL